MSSPYRRWLPLGVGLLLVAGCLRPVRDEIDQGICLRANHVVDLEPLSPAEPTGSARKVSSSQPEEAKAAEAGVPAPRPTLSGRLKVPAEVPGSSAADIRLPPLLTGKREEIEAAINRYFPPLPPLGPDPQPAPGPNGQPLTLADLQKLALTNSPVMRQAAADVKAAEGAARQAGAYPNPTVGFTAQNQGPGGGPNYGAVLGQTVKTFSKLKLAEAAGIMDLENARLRLRATEADLFSQVRQNYFAVLVARENVRASRALAKLTDEVFIVLVQQLKGGEVATYEPMQLRVVALQTRGALIQARNAYATAWKQLAATLGLPAMPATELAGGADMAIPRYHYDQVLARVLTTHTDALTALNDIQKARYNLRLAQVTPLPDVTLQTTIYRDLTPPGPAETVATVQVGVTLPVWDLNLGNILQNQGNLLKSVEEPHKTRDDLTSRVADAFGRYENGRILLEMYRRDILPNQVQAFRAAVARHARAGEPEKGGISFNDLVTAEQTLVSVIQTYLGALGDQWKAVVDVAALLQTDDLFQGSEVYPVAPIPDLEHMLSLPCDHPCSPLAPGAFTGLNGEWPPAAPPEWSSKTPPGPAAPAPGSPQRNTAAPGDAASVAPASRPVRLGLVVEVAPELVESSDP